MHMQFSFVFKHDLQIHVEERVFFLLLWLVWGFEGFLLLGEEVSVKVVW